MESMNNLIPDVLTKVFEFLPLEDRKNGKLVCGYWYDVLTSWLFQKKEKIVCRGLYDSEEITSSLLAYRCQIYSLEFQSVNDLEGTLDFWKQRGKEIKELSVRRDVDDLVLPADIIIYCENMTHLNMYPPNQPHYKHLHPPLDVLISKHIVRPNLISITSHVPEDDDLWMTKLSTVFPAIRELHLDVTYEEEAKHNEFLKNLRESNLVGVTLSLHCSHLPASKWNDDDSWSALLSPFGSGGKEEDGWSHMPANGLFSEIPSWTMLQKLDLSYILEYSDSPYNENLLVFISRQKMLKSCRIEFYFNYHKEEEYPCKPSTREKFLHTLLDSCTNLRSLVFWDHSGFDYHRQLFVDRVLLEKLVGSNLEVLEMGRYNVYQKLDFSECLNLKNYTLKYLTVSRDSECSNWLPLLQIFLGLKHISVPSSMGIEKLKFLYSDEFHDDNTNIFNMIISHNTHPVGFNVMESQSNEECLENDFVPSARLCLSKLTNLRHLYLPLHVCCSYFPGNLPKLEYLHVSYHYYKSDPSSSRFELKPSYYEAIKKLADESHMLKFLKLEHEDANMPKAVVQNLCAKLKREPYLFHSSESLRVLVMKSQNKTNCTVHFYDRARKKFFDTKNFEFVELRLNSSEMDLFGYETYLKMRYPECNYSDSDYSDSDLDDM